MHKARWWGSSEPPVTVIKWGLEAAALPPVARSFSFCFSLTRNGRKHTNLLPKDPPRDYDFTLQKRARKDGSV